MKHLDVQSLKKKIDTTAIKCCKLMSPRQKEIFFKYQEKREKKKESYNAKYSSIRMYYKGQRKGEVRDVYEIDGVEFGVLWNMLIPYAYSSSIKSHSFNPTVLEDSLSEIKFLLFRVLRFFGPEPNGEKLSLYFRKIVNNVLTNNFDKKNRAVSQVNYEAQSLFEDVFDSDGDSVTRIESIPVNSHELTIFNSEIPEELKKPVELLLAGVRLTEVAKKCRVERYRLKSQLVAFLHE